MKDDHRSFIRNFCSCKEKARKNFRRFFFLFFGLSFRNCKSCVYKDDRPSFNSSLRSSHIWFSYHSKFQPCLCWKVSPRGMQAKTPWWQRHKAMPRGKRIAYKLHVITENITKHDDSLSKEGGKPKTGLNCLHNLNNEKRHYKYKASYQIGTKSTNIWSKKKERAKKVKRGKEESHSLWKQKKKSMPCFPFPERSTPCKGLWTGHIWYSPTGNSWLWNSTFVYPQRQTRHAYATSAGQTVSPGKPRRLFGTSAPEGEWTCNCLKGQYLSKNGLFGTSYGFSWVWPCNEY